MKGHYFSHFLYVRLVRDKMMALSMQFVCNLFVSGRSTVEFHAVSGLLQTAFTGSGQNLSVIVQPHGVHSRNFGAPCQTMFQERLVVRGKTRREPVIVEWNANSSRRREETTKDGRTRTRVRGRNKSPMNSCRAASRLPRREENRNVANDGVSAAADDVGGFGFTPATEPINPTAFDR